MTYNELLLQEEWWSKCNEILSRDHYTCKDCGCLGFHNGYNYLKLSRLEEMDSLLKRWKFNGMLFSDFCKTFPKSNPSKIKGIKVKEEFCDDNLFIYRLMLFPCKSPLFPSVLQVPSKVLLPTTKKISTLDADVYYMQNMSCKDNSLSPSGRVFLFDFEDILSEKIFVNIEFTMPFMIDNVPFEENVINVVYENKLISLRLSPYNSGIRGLNIHHTYYIKRHKPWEYDNDALVTLCEDCHKKRHETSHIPLYDSNKRLINNLIPCDRCGGSGYLPQYKHVEHGICFKCGGEGVVLNDL